MNAAVMMRHQDLNTLGQIEEGQYVEEPKSEYCHTIYKYGIACYKKKCKVVCEKGTVKNSRWEDL